jgi:hypothetical protein
MQEAKAGASDVGSEFSRAQALIEGSETNWLFSKKRRKVLLAVRRFLLLSYAPDHQPQKKKNRK